MRVQDYLWAITEAKSMEEIWDMHVERMASYGFDRLLYGYTQYLTPSSLGDPEDLVLLSNHDPEYVNTFIGSGLYFHAPMVQWSRNHDGAASWGVIGQMEEAKTLTPAEKKVVEFNQRMGVLAGYTVSFKSVSARAKGAIALTAPKGSSQADVDVIWANHGKEIVLMNNVMHLKLLTLPYSGARPLTKRQREVLEWVGDGKTTQDIAVLLGLTPATVEKHLRLAREALDVDTTAQAVLKASFQNQMFILEDGTA
ncbi:MAG: LuxR family transcriptional regulator [Rhodobacteraceae bacterium]|nr:LuxR family transcriptional regulator [Paracoccaceae bacterium]